MALIGRKRMMVARSWQKPAHFREGQSAGYAPMLDCGSIDNVARRSSKRPAANCQHRYPSPDWSAQFSGRPVFFFRHLIGGKSAVIGYQALMAIEFSARSADSGAALKTMLGRIICIRNLSSSLRLPCLALPVALKVTWNAVLSALARVSLPPKCLALTARVQSLPVQPLAFFVTTQASPPAASHDNRAQSGRLHNRNRRRGQPPAAFSCFGDGI